MSCTGCSLGTVRNPGGNFVAVRLADAEDGKATMVFAGEISLAKGEHIIVDTDEGPEFAEVTNTAPALAKPCSSKKAKRFLRLASDSEYSDYIERLEMQEKAFRFASQRIFQQRLEMKLVKCAVPFDRRKLTLIYESEKRINTRDLARDLSDEFGVRVELKIIGVRDVTRLLGGIGSCGYTLCCSTWLKSFHPVTIRMAKLQGIAPNPSKLTGNCGRLKCCVAYELEGGIEAARRLASKSREKNQGASEAAAAPAS